MHFTLHMHIQLFRLNFCVTFYPETALLLQCVGFSDSPMGIDSKLQSSSVTLTFLPEMGPSVT